MMSPLVEMRQIVKHFPGILANDQITFAARKGEIHGLLGENGAGKTTLMNILYGLYRQDSGDVLFEDKLAHLDSPKKALELGIGMVHQHFRLIPRLTVLENIVLGLKTNSLFRLNIKDAEARVAALSEQYGLKIHPKSKVWELSVGEQQRVEIIKAMYRDAKLLILDEPTAVLTPQEVDSLFEMLKTMVGKGYTIIFITHKLNEVMELCNWITVLRNGQVVATIPTAQSDKKMLARMMVGREVLFQVEKPDVTPGKPVLKVENLSVLNDKGLKAVQGVSLTVHVGEILGIAGVSGNGQRELIEALNGLRRVEAGTVFFEDVDITNAPPKKIIDCGVGYIPEDRMRVGLATSLSIADNAVLKSQDTQRFSHGWFLNQQAMTDHARALVQTFDVKTPSVYIPVGRLSGGNLQKIILAREISRDVKLLIASQPTRGLDVGAIEYVQTTLLEQKRQGKAILLISENLDETLHLSDRIAVIYEGQIVGIVSAKEADRREIGLMMAGGHN
jgi:ABC-type uncharacterized transport system ATPase subunit